MKSLQYVTTYKLYHSSVKNNFSVAVISDLHFSYKVVDSKLFSIYQTLKRIDPCYILIAGDLIDSSNMIEDDKEKKRLIDFLIRISQIGKVIIVLGNHDLYKRGKYRDIYGKKSKVCNYFNQEFFERVSHISNVYLLNNKVYQDENVYICGICLPFSYYKSVDSHSENKKILLETIRENYRILHRLPSDKIKILMIHSPVYLNDLDVSKELLEFDYIISGHMHNGCVFLGLHELWHNSYGIISPSKTLFPKYVRNTLRKKGDKLVVNGALVTFQENTGWLQVFNFLYPLCSTVLNFTNDRQYDTEQLSKSTKYYR